MHMDMSEEQFCTEIYRENAGRSVRGPRFVQACAVEMHMDMSEEPFCTEIDRENAGRKFRDTRSCESAQSKCTGTFHKSHFVLKFKGNWPDTPDTTSIKHRALTLSVRTPSVWPHCLGKNMFPKHQLDTAPIDFHNSFPPTKRSKTCERIEFPSGEYVMKEDKSTKTLASCAVSVSHSHSIIRTSACACWDTPDEPLTGTTQKWCCSIYITSAAPVEAPFNLCLSSSHEWTQKISGGHRNFTTDYAKKPQGVKLSNVAWNILHGFVPHGLVCIGHGARMHELSAQERSKPTPNSLATLQTA